MGILLQAENFDVSGRETTSIGVATAASDTTIMVDSTQGFADDDYIIVGKIGEERTEIVQIASVDSTTQLTVGAMSYAHFIDDPIRKTPYNQVKYYRSTSEDGTYTEIASKNMDVDNKARTTNYDDTSGTTSNWYKYTSYNSSSDDETAVSDSIAFEGGSTLYCTVQDFWSVIDLDEDNTSAPLNSQILIFIEARTKLIENDTGSFFVAKSMGSSDDYQYLDGKGSSDPLIYLGHSPIISVTSFETTQNAPNSTATWDVLTEGRDNDYILDKETGFAEIVKSSKIPDEVSNSVRWYGVVGYNSIPSDVRVAVAKGVAMDIAKSNQYRAIIKGREGFISDRLTSWEQDWKIVVEHYKADHIDFI